MAKIHFLLIPLLFLAACQATPAPTPTATAVPPTATPPSPTATPIPVSLLEVDEADLKGVELEIWHALDGAAEALFALQLAEFNKENEWGITVTASDRGNYSLLYTDIVDEEKATGRARILLGLSEQASAWHQLGLLTPLTPYINDPIWGFSVAERADIPEVFLAQGLYDDEQIAIPAQRSARFLLYNQSWGEALGFDTPPLSFDDFAEQSCAANKAMRSDAPPENDARGGWIVDDAPYTVLAWMRAFDGGVIGKDGGYEFINNQNIEALKELKELYDKNCAWVSSSDLPYENFATRNALFISAEMDEFPEIDRAFAAANSRDEWTVLPYPGLKGGRVIVYGTSFTLQDADEAEALAAWLFIKWMLGAENQAKFTQSSALFPITVSALVALSDYEAANPHWREAVDLLLEAEGHPQAGSWHRARYVLGDGFAYIFRADEQAGSVAVILAEMNNIAKELRE